MASTTHYGTILRGEGETTSGTYFYLDFYCVSSTSSYVTWRSFGTTVLTVYTPSSVNQSSAVGTYTSLYEASSLGTGIGEGRITVSDSVLYYGLATNAQMRTIALGTDDSRTTLFKLLLGSNTSSVISSTAAAGVALGTLTVYDTLSTTNEIKCMQPDVTYYFLSTPNSTSSSIAGYYTKWKIVATYQSVTGSGNVVLYANNTTTNGIATWSTSTSNMVGNGARSNFFTYITVPSTYVSGNITYNIKKVQFIPYGSTSQSGTYTNSTSNRYHFSYLRMTVASSNQESTDTNKLTTLSAMSNSNSILVDSPSKLYLGDESPKYVDLTYKPLAEQGTVEDPVTYRVYVLKRTGETGRYNYTASFTPSGTSAVTATASITTSTSAVNTDLDGTWYSLGTISSTASTDNLKNHVTLTRQLSTSTTVETLDFVCSYNSGFYFAPQKQLYTISPMFAFEDIEDPTDAIIRFYGQMNINGYIVSGYNGNYNRGVAVAEPQYTYNGHTYAALELDNGSGVMQNQTQLYFGLIGTLSASITELEVRLGREFQTTSHIQTIVTPSDTQLYLLVLITEIG